MPLSFPCDDHQNLATLALSFWQKPLGNFTTWDREERTELERRKGRRAEEREEGDVAGEGRRRRRDSVCKEEREKSDEREGEGASPTVVVELHSAAVPEEAAGKERQSHGWSRWRTGVGDPSCHRHRVVAVSKLCSTPPPSLLPEASVVVTAGFDRTRNALALPSHHH
ncbi:hypothetical protein PIB30_049359 [Stylosanthes scabra]|uniref:Uncharacterized protein n=1 Tax=Stylosanthes scabra TaxID=79078 RepID=A0ABU6SH42_9FABA|nr:hypothetical protein [Stylosanthes scabra]